MSARELLVAIAHALAPERRVLVVGDDFGVLQLFAGLPVKELVVVSALADPDAPAGTTMTGAPLRMRPDWAERKNSKDVVLDLTGEAPADGVERVLKKHGIYLSLVENEATRALPEVRAVGSKAGGALATGDASTPLVMGTPAGEGPTVFAAGKTEPELPDVCVVTAEGGDPNALSEAQARLATADALVASTQAELTAARAELTRLPGVTAERDAAVAAQRAAEAELATLKAAHDELTTDYEQVRDTLAAQRIEAGRADRLRAKLDSLAAATSTEIAELRERLRASEGPLAEKTELVEARDAAREAYRTVTAALLGLVAKLVPDWPGGGAPAHDSEQLSEWIATLADSVERAQAARERRIESAAADARDLAALRQRVDELSAALAARPPAAPEPASDATPAPDEDARVAALEAALEAERALRESERGAIERARSAAAHAQGQVNQIRSELAAARERAARAGLAQACAEEARRVTRAEAALQRERLADLEAMLDAHGRMQQLLAAGLRAAEDARDDAEAAARVADANLATLHAEFERLRPNDGDRSAAASARAERQRGLQLERALADAQRQIARLEERVRRHAAERQLRPPAR